MCELCVSDLCVSDLGVSDLCVSDLFVCVGGGGRGGGGGGGGGRGEDLKTRTPHNDVGKKCPKWTSETHLGILASFFPIQNGPKSPKIPFLDVLKFRHPKIVPKLRKHPQDLDSVRNLERPPPQLKLI